jgi:uncharacterized protein YdhG (YjbR/CyaY superfamily)
MAERKAAKKGTTKPARGVTRKGSSGLTAEERAALRETVQERRGNTEGEGVVLAKIRSMKGADREMGERVHAIVRANAPDLTPKLWYGMPAYANKDGKVVLFFQESAKFKYRYATLGFQDAAQIDEGNVWPTAFALTKLTAAEEAKIGALVKKAVR